MPAYILVVDDLTPFVKGVSDSVLEFLSKSEPVLTVIGCKKGNEEQLSSEFERLGTKVKVRYLGQLDGEDVKQLAKFASPSSHTKLADEVISVLRSENFTRTPFTASLLISILLRGSIVNPSASETGILETFLSNLLGRGNPHEDSRLVIDQPGRELILAHLAEYFVETSTSGIDETNLLQFFADVFKRYGWTETPRLILENFLALRILRKIENIISFSRNSYLYIFAAKRAQVNQELLEKMSNQPLKYAQILRDYSALTRNDDQLLSKLNALLDGMREAVMDKGSPYQKLALTNIPELSGNVSGNYAIAIPDNPEMREKFASAKTSLDRIEIELPAFPSESVEDLPLTFKLARSLSLVSSILRDSDQVSDLELKRNVLVRALEGWGILISALNSDKVFLDMISNLTEEIIDLFSGMDTEVLDVSEREGLKEEILRAIPVAIALGGIDGTLASRKLITSFNDALSRNELISEEETAIGAVFFLFALKPKEWASQIRSILNNHQDNIWILSVFLFSLLADSYIRGTDGDEENLLELCLELMDRSRNFSSSKARIDFLEANRTNLKTKRIQNQVIARIKPEELS